jgi:hypothetical protein
LCDKISLITGSLIGLLTLSATGLFMDGKRAGLFITGAAISTSYCNAGVCSGSERGTIAEENEVENTVDGVRKVALTADEGKLNLGNDAGVMIAFTGALSGKLTGISSATAVTEASLLLLGAKSSENLIDHSDSIPEFDYLESVPQIACGGKTVQQVKLQYPARACSSGSSTSDARWVEVENQSDHEF